MRQLPPSQVPVVPPTSPDFAGAFAHDQMRRRQEAERVVIGHNPRVGGWSILWELIPALTCGMLAPVPFVHAAVRLQTRRTVVYALLYSGATLVLFLFIGAFGSKPDECGKYSYNLIDYMIMATAFLMASLATFHAFMIRRLGSSPEIPGRLGYKVRPRVTTVSAGRVNEAIGLYRQTLAERLRMLGPDHPDTLSSQDNLACAYASAGWLAEAIPLYEQTRADRMRVLGAEHPDSLVSRNNLAYAYASAGRLAEAIPLYEQTLADSLRVLDAGHPVVAMVRGNLSVATNAAKRRGLIEKFLGR